MVITDTTAAMIPEMTPPSHVKTAPIPSRAGRTTDATVDATDWPNDTTDATTPDTHDPIAEPTDDIVSPTPDTADTIPSHAADAPLVRVDQTPAKNPLIDSQIPMTAVRNPSFLFHSSAIPATSAMITVRTIPNGFILMATLRTRCAAVSA